LFTVHEPELAIASGLIVAPNRFVPLLVGWAHGLADFVAAEPVVARRPAANAPRARTNNNFLIR
jgi:hypothetical protein